MRSVRFLKALAGDPDVPRAVRWLLLFAVLPIPGPVDELAGALALFLLRRMRPGVVARHWRESARPGPAVGPRVAVAACRLSPGSAAGELYPDGDADLLRPALVAAGASAAEMVSWDDPAVDWRSFDLVLISSTWDSVDRPREYLDWVRRVAGATALVNPADVVEWNLDKRYLRDLEAAGLPVVPTTWVAPGESMPELPSGRDVVVKPAVSAGGRSTAWHSAGAADAARAHVTALQEAGATAMVQEHVAAVGTAGELKAVYVDGAYSHASRVGGLLGRDEAILERPWEKEVAVATVEASPDERAVGDAVMRELARRFGEPPVYARVDLVADDAGAPRILEVELIDPMLRLDAGPGSADRLAAAVLARGGR